MIRKPVNSNHDLILLLLLLNTSSHISYNGWYYCYCGDEKKEQKKERNKKEKICLMCKIPMIFTNFERDLAIICLIWISNEYHSKLYFHTNQLFNKKKRLYLLLSLPKERAQGGETGCWGKPGVFPSHKVSTISKMLKLIKYLLFDPMYI